MTIKTKNEPRGKTKNKLPGDLTDQQYINEVIRVNQAGEYGAKRIYAGQMAVLKNAECYETIKHMAEQEEVHLAYFSEQISKRKIRPTGMLPIWHLGAFAMGAATALMGEKSAMACTVAVEEVIDEHYQEQIDTLGDEENDLKEKINKFREEELEHKNTGLENDAEHAVAYPFLHQAIRGITKFAIEVSKKV